MAVDGAVQKVPSHCTTLVLTPSFAKFSGEKMLMPHAEFEGHVMPFIKVVMTGKSGALYKAVFKRIKEELPDSVNPETVMCDFEAALQNGLQEIFPDAIVTGCWFHFSQVS